MEHVDHRIVQLQKKYTWIIFPLDMYLSSYLSSCWTLVHVRGLWPLQKSGTDGYTDSQTRTAFWMFWYVFRFSGCNNWSSSSVQWSSTKRSSAPASPRGSWYRGQGTIHRAFIPPAIYPPFIYPPLPSPLIPHPSNHHTMVFRNQVYQEFTKKINFPNRKIPIHLNWTREKKRSCVHFV